MAISRTGGKRGTLTMYPFDLRQGVGPGMPNLPADVKLVRDWLNRWAPVLRRMHLLENDLSVHLHHALEHFQRKVLGEAFPTGKVVPGDRTARKLQETPRPPLPTHFPPTPPVGALPMNPSPGTPLRLPPRTGFQLLSIGDYTAAAKELGCETRMIRAMAKQEGRDHGFDHFNRPTILYEPLHFRRLAGHQTEYMAKYHDLTFLQADSHHPYGPPSAQWRRLQKAYLIDARAALNSVSWGKFQILGEYFYLAGHASLQSYVSAMCTSEQEQLNAFVSYIRSKHLESALARKDWEAVACGYNGKYFKRYHYDTALQQQYEALSDN